MPSLHVREFATNQLFILCDVKYSLLARLHALGLPIPLLITIKSRGPPSGDDTIDQPRHLSHLLSLPLVSICEYL